MEGVRVRGAASLPLAAGLGLLAAAACHSTVVSPAELRPPSGARSVVVGVESATVLDVTAFDLADAPNAALPHLEADFRDSVVVSARYYDAPLTALRIPTGPIPPGSGARHPLPGLARVLDTHRILRDDVDSGWLDDGLGPAFARHQSDAFPRPSRCGTFEPGPTFDLGDPSPVRRAVPFAGDALVLQTDALLYRVSATGVRPLTAVAEAIRADGAASIRALTSLPTGAVVLACQAGAPRLFHLDGEERLVGLPADGLSGCPSELSSWGEQLFGLVHDQEVYILDGGAASWRRLGSFSALITDTPQTVGVSFIATGPDEVTAIHVDTSNVTAFVHHALRLDAEGETKVRLPTPELASMQVSRMATGAGFVAVVIGSAIDGSTLFLRDSSGSWSVAARLESQAVLTTAASTGGFVLSGRYGYAVEVQLPPGEPLELCPHARGLAPGSNATEFVALSNRHLVLAGNSNREVPMPWTRPQKAFVVRLD